VTFSLKKTVVLVGMMGAGKTTVGMALARRLGAPFCDSDAEIVRAANMPIADIFARDGEAFFRARESEILKRLLASPPMVLATGGGAFLREDNRRIIAESAVSVWLKAELDLLWSRVRHKDTRPLLRTADPHATLRALCAEREPAYAMADITVQALASHCVEDMAGRVIEALLKRPDVLERTK